MERRIRMGRERVRMSMVREGSTVGNRRKN
jgi:hypothetical protein